MSRETIDQLRERIEDVATLEAVDAAIADEKAHPEGERKGALELLEAKREELVSANEPQSRTYVIPPPYDEASEIAGAFAPGQEVTIALNYSGEYTTDDPREQHVLERVFGFQPSEGSEA